MDIDIRIINLLNLFFLVVHDPFIVLPVLVCVVFIYFLEPWLDQSNLLEFLLSLNSGNFLLTVSLSQYFIFFGDLRLC